MIASAGLVAITSCALLLGGEGPGVEERRAPVFSHPVDVAKPPAAFVAVNRALREARCIRADFAEEKRIRVLKRPLRSAGHLVLCAGVGLYRAVREPYAREILVTTAGIAQRDERGRIERVEVDEQPIAKGFIDAFLLVFSGDEQALAAQFELYFEGDQRAWTLGFVPKRKPLSRFIAGLVVSGHGGVLDTLAVDEVNGDSTSTRFSNVITDTDLTSDERETCFGWQR